MSRTRDASDIRDAKLDHTEKKPITSIAEPTEARVWMDTRGGAHETYDEARSANAAILKRESEQAIIDYFKNKWPMNIDGTIKPFAKGMRYARAISHDVGHSLWPGAQETTQVTAFSASRAGWRGLVQYMLDHPYEVADLLYRYADHLRGNDDGDDA